MKRRYAYRPYGGKRRKGLLTKIILIVLAVGLVCFGALETVVLLGSVSHIQGDPRVMVILGAQIREDGPSGLLQDRLDTALDYLEDHPGMTVVVTGGQGRNEPTTEAEGMRDYLVANGVAEEQILLETESTSTAENIRYTMELLEDAGCDTTADILVVSNGFHLARVRMLWNKICGGDDNLSTLAAPSTHPGAALQSTLREPFAMVKSALFD